MASFDPQPVIDALRERPDGAAALAIEGTRVAAVGGFVRDTLLGREPRELDLVIEGDLREVARQLGGEAVGHPQFLAVHVSRDGWAIEVTHARREHYEQPGALPRVAAATIEEDLARRDFTVNALAVTLADGRLLAAADGLEDLASGRLRVLHDASFIDDPTRLLRLARYARRTGFAVEPATAELAERATLATLSGARVGAELALILREPDPLGVLEDLQGKLAVVVERAVIERALELAPADADRGLLILAGALRQSPPSPGWLESLELGARARDVLAAAPSATELARELALTSRPSEIRSLVRGVPVELIALAGALGGGDSATRWLGELRQIKLEIGGDDLLAAGLPQGPAIGARLERTLERRLDGAVAAGREAELADALGESP